MNERTDQPSKVATEEAVRPPDKNVVTDDREFNPDTSQANLETHPAASDDKKPDQTTEKTVISEDNQKQPHKRDRSAERKIGKLSKQLSRFESERNADRQQIESLQGEIETLKQTTAAASPEPELKNFASPQEYAKAYSTWESGQTAAPSKKAGDPAPKPGTRDPAANAQHDYPGKTEPDKEVIDFQNLGKKKLGDEFSEALEIPGTAIDKDMGEFLLDSEFGPEIYVHLANNQDEARKIYDSSTRRKSTALEALEAKAKKGELDIEGQVIVDSGDDKGKTPPDPDKSKLGAQDDDNPDGKKTGSQQTRAKDPPSDTSDTGQSTLTPNPENESMDDYAARRNKAELRKRGFPV